MTSGSQTWHWSDLPRPKTMTSNASTMSVAVTQRVVSKMAEHMLPGRREPWDFFLHDAELLDRFRDAARSNRPVTTEDAESLLTLLREECDQALSRPVAISFFRSQKRSTGQWQHVWLLVLPSGLLAILQDHSTDHELRSCYFHQVTVNCRSDRLRVLRVMTKFVNRYSVLERTGPNIRRRLATNEEVEVKESLGLSWHTGVEFCELQAWGFDENGFWDSSRLSPYEVGEQPELFPLKPKPSPEASP